MTIPDHWAEARRKRRLGQRSVTVQRFGWSNVSAADAQANAEARSAEAMERIAAGEKLDRRERKVPYNGADGVPIREEVVSRFGNAAVTRNRYGALCLNTPEVLFADVDFPEPRRPGLGASTAILLWAALSPFAVLFFQVGSTSGLVLILTLAAGIGIELALSRRRATPQMAAERSERAARERIAAFLAAHPDWRLALYRTPAGLRALALHRRFRPDEPEVAAFYEAIGADPAYVRMCRHQQCFRARVSPKPWRIGIRTHLGPRPGVWPINPARLPDRVRWVAAYDLASRGYAACRRLEELGQGPRDPAAEALRRIHDELARADSGLPIA